MTAKPETVVTLANDDPFASEKYNVFVSDEQLAERFGKTPRYFKEARMRGEGPPFARLGRSPRTHLGLALRWACDRLINSTSEESNE